MTTHDLTPRERLRQLSEENELLHDRVFFYQAELAYLKQRLASKRNDYTSLENKLLDLTEELEQLKADHETLVERLANTRGDLCAVEEILVKRESELQSTNDELEATKRREQRYLESYRRALRRQCVSITSYPTSRLTLFQHSRGASGRESRRG